MDGSGRRSAGDHQLTTSPKRFETRSESSSQRCADPPSFPDEVRALLVRCDFPPTGHEITCAVSGGPDSLALLVLAVAAGCTVTAIHVDHGLRPHSAQEAKAVGSIARRFGAAFRSVRVEVPPGPNLEARARAARLSVLPVDVATGHTMDDQAETVLVNLLRGAGARGLAGMRPGRRHPILRLRRSETQLVCEAVGLQPLKDPMNDDPRYVRNRVRRDLLPLCAAIAGRDVVPLLARQADVLREEADFLDDLAGQALPQPSDARSLAAAPLVLARRAVRGWLAETAEGHGYPPSFAEVCAVLDVAAGRRRATELSGGRRVRRSAGRLAVSVVRGGHRIPR